MKLSPTGELLFDFTTRDPALSKPAVPCWSAPDGDVWISDAGNHRVVRLNPERSAGWHVRQSLAIRAHRALWLDRRWQQFTLFSTRSL